MAARPRETGGVYKSYQFSSRSLLIGTLVTSVLCLWLIPTNHVAEVIAGGICIVGFVLVWAWDRRAIRGFGVLRGSAYSGAIGGMIGGAFWVFFSTVTLAATDYTIGDLLERLPYRLFWWTSVSGMIGVATGCLIAARRFCQPARGETFAEQPVLQVDHVVQREGTRPIFGRRAWLRQRWHEAPAWMISLAAHLLLIFSFAPLALDLDRGYHPASGPNREFASIEIVFTDETHDNGDSTDSSMPTKAITVVANSEESLDIEPVSHSTPRRPPVASSSAVGQTAGEIAGNGKIIGDVGYYLFGTGGRVKTMVELEVPFHATDVAFSPSGHRLAIGGCSKRPVAPGPGYVTVWNLANDTKHALPELTQFVQSVSFSPDGSTLAVTTQHLGGGKEGVELGGLWNIETGRRIRALMRPSGFWSCNIGLSAVYSPDGEKLALGYMDRLLLCDAATGTQLHTRSTGLVSGVEFSPDGSMLLVIGKRVDLLDVESWSIKHSLPDTARSACFSPDGTTILTAASGSLRFWDTASGELKRTLNGYIERVYASSFSPDGRFMAIGGTHGTVRIWDVPSGDVRCKLFEHSDTVLDVAFDPDGKMLASAGRDGVRLWNLRKILSDASAGSVPLIVTGKD